jgi:signal peptidase I
VSARGRRAAGIAITLVLVGLWVVLLRPQSLGGPLTYLVIRGNSMEPTYHTGDLVILRSVPAYGTDEIVAYRVPAGDIGAGHLIVHRIAGGDGDAGFVVQGDNNPSVDPWMPRSGDIAGAAWILVPGAGRILTFLHTPAALGAIAVAVLVAFAVGRAPAGRSAVPVAPAPLRPVRPRTKEPHPAR